MTITFTNPYAMAVWINGYTQDARYQEQLLFQGIQNNYTITIKSL